MAVDKNLFLYDLAIVAIMKDEAPYVKEWIDYHLLAGANHFYIYDNGSTDNLKEILQPYIDAGLVTYIFYPGKSMQFPVYSDAVKNFKFFCRYMAFIDVDEFIFPKNNRSIIEVVDEVLSKDENAAALSINWQMFGSNGQEKADLSRGVLERFTSRSAEGNLYVKNVANPRYIDHFDCPHNLGYFMGSYSVNENSEQLASLSRTPYFLDKKITINHYHVKSKEEYLEKIKKGNVAYAKNLNTYNLKRFFENDKNEVFDDGILKYRDMRKNFYAEYLGGGDWIYLKNFQK